jgi:hypothetical protein
MINFKGCNMLFVSKNLRGRHAWAASTAALGLGLMLPGCGGSQDSNDPQLRDAQQSTAVILEQARAEAAPEGVDATIYMELLSELERVLTTGEVTRFVSAPPSGLANQITDLAYTDNDLESYSLSWSYTNAGDYDNNSEVNIADLARIGQNFGKKQADADWDAVARLADGDGNGEINIADVTPIGQHFGKSLGGYNVYRANDAVSDPEMIGSIAFADITDPTLPLVFTVPYVLDAPGDFQNFKSPFFSVRPYDAQGNEPADISTAATVQGDDIVLYSSSYIDDYKGLRWQQPPGEQGAAPPPIPDWIYSRLTQLTPGVFPPPKLDQESYLFEGRAMPQSMDSRFNLSLGTGRISLVSEDGLSSIKLRGTEGAFAIRLSSEVAAKAPFDPDSLAATPFAVINTDSTLLSVEEYLVDGTEYAAEFEAGNSQLGVFFPEDPLDLPMRAGLPDWAEKYCMLLDATGSIPDLQEY